MLKKYFRNFVHKNSKIKRTNILKNIEPHIISAHKNLNHYSNQNSYYNNVIVYKCINLISNSFSQIKWVVYKKNDSDMNKLSKHKIVHLLNNPNKLNCFSDILSSLTANMLLYGNSYILLEKNHSLDRIELFHISPENIGHIYSKDKIIGYKFLHNSQERIFYINSINNHYSIFHICNDQLGNTQNAFSPLSNICRVIELYSKILDWNQSLLNNATKPSGTLSFKDGHNLTQEQFERLKEQFYENFTGASNTGKPLILEGELEWKDLEKYGKLEKFLELKDSLARDIALSFNIPAQLLGIKGDNTYNNMKEARLAFWEDNVIPLANKVFFKLSQWFSDWFEEDIYITFDMDTISALNEKRENLWSKISNADFMTINEKRAVFNLPQILEGNSLN